jgi:hypothetical protein
MRALILACLLATSASAQDTRITIQLTFDPTALAELVKRGEGVVIGAYYAGEPNANSTFPPDEMGMIYIGSETITILPENRSVIIGAGLGGSAMGMTDQPMLNVNVYSARFTDDNNLLSCGIVDGPVAAIVGTTQTIHCKLIDG